MKKFFLLAAIAGTLLSCRLENEPAILSSPYQFVRPAHFPEPTYTFRNNPITEAGFLLGKRLFDEPLLSVDGSVACSNCHVQAVAFADPQHRLSVGVDDRAGTRNAPGIANMAFMEEFFWDGGVTHLDFVPLNAIENPVEMDETMANVVRKLNVHPEYPALFRKAFGPVDSINAPLMLQALSQFMVLLVSADSAYDRYLLKEGELTAEQLNGKALFEKKCAGCHSGLLFTNQSYRNNGLDSLFADPGRARISEWDGDLGKFKVPSLRNVALTAPYMHDGRFATLEEVLGHYASGVKHSPTLAPELQVDGRLGIELTEEEKRRIIDFLHTLTDWSFVRNPLF